MKERAKDTDMNYTVLRDRRQSKRMLPTSLLSVLFLQVLVRTIRMKTKECNKCKQVKSVTEFHKQSRAKDGLKRYCKLCAKQANEETFARKNGCKIPYKRESLNHVIPEGMKFCAKCNKSKSVDRFGLNLNTKSKLNTWCRECTNTDKRNKRRTLMENIPLVQSHKGSMASLYWSYKLTESDFQDMMNAQKGCCAICDIDFGILSRRAAVDHNHSTGKVRGLLCDSCNTLIGKLEKLPHLLQNVNKYLNKYNI